MVYATILEIMAEISTEKQVSADVLVTLAEIAAAEGNPDIDSSETFGHGRNMYPLDLAGIAFDSTLGKFYRSFFVDDV